MIKVEPTRSKSPTADKWIPISLRYEFSQRIRGYANKLLRELYSYWSNCALPLPNRKG